jgi:aminomethyltransferase
MKKTKLYDIQSLQRADFDEFSGWMMPKSYDSLSEEYRTVRNNVGIIDLSHRGKIRLSGKEHIKFLQGILSNDVNKLEVGNGQYSTFLTPKGRMIADMRLCRKSDSVLLDLEPGLNEKVKELFLKYKISYKVNIEDITDSLSLISVHGPNAKKLTEKTLGQQIPDLKDYDFITYDTSGKELLIANMKRTLELGFDIFVSSDGANKTLWESLIAHGEELYAKPVGLDALETLRIEAGIPRFGVDMDENTIPIEAGLWNALSFEKGCYVGQEVIARIKWRGHVNWHLIGFKIEGDEVPEKDSKIIRDQREIGYITSGAFSPKLNQIIALGYIRREFNNPGTQVTIKTKSNKTFSAEVSEIPFYDQR